MKLNIYFRANESANSAGSVNKDTWDAIIKKKNAAT